MVPRHISIYMYVVLDYIRYFRERTRSFIFRTLAGYNSIVCNSNSSKKNNVSIGFFIIGAIIFSFYLYFTIWNIYYSNTKQREESYPTVREKQIAKENEPKKDE